LYVLRHYYRHGDKAGLDAVLHTLRKMADGGMHDHIGKGFARYSVDERWHVPHFEKMLYDQGQLVPLYIEAYQITGDNVYADTARDVLGYVQRDMTGEHGQFYSAEDADSPLPENPSEQAEGAFYVWEKGQIDAALGEDAASIFNMIYGVEAGGNVRSDPHNEFHNKNVLIVEHTIDEAATKFNRSPSDVRALVDASLDKLFHIRERRPRPHLDDKTITAWNGLMISAFARAYTVLGDPSHLASAQKAAAFIRERLYDEKTHTLQRRFRAGESAIEGYVDDYAFFIQALLDLYDASFDTAYLAWAVHLQDTQDRVFWDTQEGGYFSTSGEDASILLRMKETYDGAEPSPNSIAAMNLLRLAQIFGDVPYLAKAQQTFMQMGAQLKSSPSATPQMMSALDFFLHKPKQVVIAGRPDADDTKAMLAAARAEFIPNRIILLADGGAGQAFLAQKQEFMKDVKPLDGKATAHVCENYVCQLPTTDLKVMMQQLKNLTADE
ncbi:MAG: thioredoxin domain-containing protein, partial [Verrucomicrobia bacterium]|nr:thioredoxin domain-containing protein [Verrucomicrobiota bacterium]